MGRRGAPEHGRELTGGWSARRTSRFASDEGCRAAEHTGKLALSGSAAARRLGDMRRLWRRRLAAATEHAGEFTGRGTGRRLGGAWRLGVTGGLRRLRCRAAAEHASEVTSALGRTGAARRGRRGRRWRGGRSRRRFAGRGCTCQARGARVEEPGKGSRIPFWLGGIVRSYPALARRRGCGWSIRHSGDDSAKGLRELAGSRARRGRSRRLRLGTRTDG
jgi:hypothetical protein